MKKGLLLILALTMALGTAWAQIDDSYRPLKPREAIAAKYPYATSNFFMAMSTNRGATYGTKTALTTFNYAVDGGWVDGISHGEILLDGVPAVCFAGGDDVPEASATVNVWFWSAATGLVEVVAYPFTDWWTCYPNLSLADNGDLYCSWGNNDWGQVTGDIFIAKSTNKGATWSAPVNVSTLIRAYDPNDSCMMYPRMAPRAIDGLHLMWDDESQNPGSAVQGMGVTDTGVVKYAKVNLALNAVMDLDNGSGYDKVVTLGLTGYDWVNTGNTQGLVIDDNQNMAAVFTKGGLPDLATREVYYVSYLPGQGLGPEINLDPGQWVGFPGISLGPDGNPAFVWHHGGDKRVYAQVDIFGIGGGLLMGTKLGMRNPGDNYIWPSVAYIGGTNPGDSLAWTANYSAGSYNGVGMYITPNWNNANMVKQYITDADFSVNGTGTYDGILASPTNQNMWVFFAGLGAIYDIPQPPDVDTILNVPDAAHMSIYAERIEYSLTQEFYIGTWEFVTKTRLYHKVNNAGTYAVIDSFLFLPGDTAYSATVTDTVFFNNLAYSTAATDTNYYYLTNIDPQGESDPSEVFIECMGTVVSGVTGDRLAASPALMLNQSWPNPARDNATISFSLPRSGAYSLKVYNVAGQVVRTYNGNGNVGMNTVNVNSRNLSNGVYFYQLNAAGSTATKKMVVLK